MTPERRDVAIKLWDEMNSKKTVKKLSAEEGLALLEKLKGAFSEAVDSVPECGICLMEMEESDGIVLAKCGHVFCKLCIQRVSNRKCPYCRANFEDSDIVNMAQATSATNSEPEEKPIVDIKFGMPPKVRALLGAIQAMHAEEKGGKYIIPLPNGCGVHHLNTCFFFSQSHLFTVHVASRYHREDHEGCRSFICAH